jgi:hypothetical protein
VSAERRLSWNQPICDACWEKRHPDRVPTRMAEAHTEREVCSDCGRRTESGIYRRADPYTVNHPAVEDEGDV